MSIACGRARIVAAGAVLVVLALWPFVTGCLAQTKDEPLVQRDFSETAGTLKFEELSRNGKTSRIKVTIKPRRSSVGDSIFVVRTFYEVAKARHCEYFVNLEESPDQDDSGATVYTAGFTNHKDADVQREFGEQYRTKPDSMSVSQFSPLFDRRDEKESVSRPTAGTSPGH